MFCYTWMITLLMFEVLFWCQKENLDIFFMSSVIDVCLCRLQFYVLIRYLCWSACSVFIPVMANKAAFLWRFMCSWITLFSKYFLSLYTFSPKYTTDLSTKSCQQLSRFWPSIHQIQDKEKGKRGWDFGKPFKSFQEMDFIDDGS